MTEKEFREKYKVNELYKPNDQEKAKAYEEYKIQQAKQFELYLNYINEVLIILKDYRIVSDFTRISARIKAIESALKNDEEKTLDDVFGFEVDFATPGEKFFVSEIIKGTLIKRKEKIYNKCNGYEAYHCSGYPDSKLNISETFDSLLCKQIDTQEEYNKYYQSLSKINKEKADNEKDKEYFESLKKYIEVYSEIIKERMSEKHLENLRKELNDAEERYFKKQIMTSNNEYIPLIEFQSKTIQVAIEANIGKARHDGYKGFSSGEIQKKYDALEGKMPLSQVPIMYTSDLKRDENGEIIPIKLRSSKTTLKKLYPDLII